MSELSCVRDDGPGRTTSASARSACRSPGVEVRLADDGELLVRGGIVMRGYRNQPEKTAEALDADGWLHTGDVAQIDDDGFVTIVDRKKELIINAAGKNMSPANIEAALKAAGPLIGQACVVGDRRPYNVALLCSIPRRTGLDPRNPEVLAPCSSRGGRRQRPPLAGGADQALRAARGRVAARRRRADADDEAQAQADRRQATRTRSRPSMAKGYAIGRSRVHDEERYADYRSGHGGDADAIRRALHRPRRADRVRRGGLGRTGRTVVIEFPSFEQARPGTTATPTSSSRGSGTRRAPATSCWWRASADDAAAPRAATVLAVLAPAAGRASRHHRRIRPVEGRDRTGSCARLSRARTSPATPHGGAGRRRAVRRRDRALAGEVRLGAPRGPASTAAPTAGPQGPTPASRRATRERAAGGHEHVSPRASPVTGRRRASASRRLRAAKLFALPRRRPPRYYFSPPLGALRARARPSRRARELLVNADSRGPTPTPTATATRPRTSARSDERAIRACLSNLSRLGAARAGAAHRGSRARYTDQGVQRRPEHRAGRRR